MHQMFVRRSILGYGIASAVLLVFGSGSQAETTQFKADLNGSSQVPTNQTAAMGTVTASYDAATRRLSWKGSYSGLSGAPTAAHIHGPAPTGANARLVVWISENVGQCSQGACKSNHGTMEHSLPNPFEGAATLTDAQANDLMAGLYYANIHTDAYPNGQLRGQLVKIP